MTVVGLATDYCVKNTALDALREGFSVRVDRAGVRGVDVAARRLRARARRAARPRVRRGVGRRRATARATGCSTQLRPHVADERVLEAMRAVPRDRFVPADAAPPRRGTTSPLPIGSGQTISQPLVVARMCELLELRGGERVLDVGTGSGYHAALLAQLGAHVWSVERHPALSERARRSLAAAGVDNVTLVVGDGARGLPEHAPYDAINVAAAARPRSRTRWPSSSPPAGGWSCPSTTATSGSSCCAAPRAGARARRGLERVRFVPLVQRLV